MGCGSKTNNSKKGRYSEIRDDTAFLGNYIHTEKFVTKNFLKHHFSIQYPGTWQIDTNDVEALFVCKMNCISEMKFCANFTVNVFPKKEGVSMEEYAKAFTENIANRFEKYKLVNTEQVMVNGLQCVIVDYKMFSHETHLGGSTALIIVGGNIVSVNCMGENQQEGAYIKYREIFYQVIKSLRFI